MSRSRHDVLVHVRDCRNCRFHNRHEMENDLARYDMARLSRRAVAGVTNTILLVRVLRDARYRASSRLLIDDAIALLAYIIVSE